MHRCFCFLILTVGLLIGISSVSAAAKRVAVLIGCNEYDNVPLTGCVTDVRNLSAALKKQGYEVWEMTDDAIDPETGKTNAARYYPHKINIEKQLPIWIPEGGLDKGDTVLFFFSGHGYRTADGIDYLVPLGFQRIEPSEMVGMSRVYEILRKSGAENIVIVTDACRNIVGKGVGEFEGSKGFGEKSLENSKALNSSEQRYAFLRSCAEGQKSYERTDGSGGNYAYYLVQGIEGSADGCGLAGIKDGIISIGELQAYTKEMVKAEAQRKNHMQIPQYERKGDDPDLIAVAASNRMNAKIGEISINPKDGAEMILIPAGEFLMGSTDADPLARGDEKPRHEVYLDTYYIYRNPVTVKQYRRFCEATGRSMPAVPKWGWIDDHPIVVVNWQEASAYAEWAMCSLPTEAQWEKAARGTDGRIYPWGNTWDSARLHCSRSTAGDGGKTAPVGSFPSGASPYGVLDMAGNVWQWCSDSYGDSYYQESPSRNPIGPTSGQNRVQRGGSWYNDGGVSFRTTNRCKDLPSNRWSDVGFRCVKRP